MQIGSALLHAESQQLCDIHKNSPKTIDWPAAYHAPQKPRAARSGFPNRQSIDKLRAQQALMSKISTNLQIIQRRIAAACAIASRAPSSVQLLAVSKSFAAERLIEAAAAGQTSFGESYLQEALVKIPQVEPRVNATLEWHFIGPVQANKTAAIAAHFDWVHGVDREKIAQRLSSARTAQQAPLQICVQVNISGEASKSGCAQEDALALCASLAQLPHLVLRGLMAIPAASENAKDSRAAFRRLRELADEIRASGKVAAAQFDTLSMGMSDDFETAIEEGATIVRIGSALFGERQS